MKISNNRIVFKDKAGTSHNVYFGGLSKTQICKFLGRKPTSIIEFGSYDGGDGLKYKIDFPEALVVSIEACPKLFGNLKYLKQFGVLPLNYAVSDHDGHTDFYQSFSRSTNKYAPVGSELRAKNSLKRKNDHLVYCETPINVPSITLATLIRKVLKVAAVDYLHIDTQGTFLRVIDGLKDIRPALIFAEVGMNNRYHNSDSIAESDNLMRKIGYKKLKHNGFDAIYKLNETT